MADPRAFDPSSLTEEQLKELLGPLYDRYLQLRKSVEKKWGGDDQIRRQKLTSILQVLMATSKSRESAEKSKDEASGLFEPEEESKEQDYLSNLKDPTPGGKDKPMEEKALGTTVALPPTSKGFYYEKPKYKEWGALGSETGTVMAHECWRPSRLTTHLIKSSRYIVPFHNATAAGRKIMVAIGWNADVTFLPLALAQTLSDEAPRTRADRAEAMLTPITRILTRRLGVSPVIIVNPGAGDVAISRAATVDDKELEVLKQSLKARVSASRKQWTAPNVELTGQFGQDFSDEED